MNKFAALLLLVSSLPIAQTSPAEQIQIGSSWFAAAPMAQARRGHSMVELSRGPNMLRLSEAPGKVMVIGGYDREPFDPSVEPLASCEIYDPATNTWTAAAPHPVAAGSRWAVQLKNGMVLVAGGAPDLASPIVASHLYDPSRLDDIFTHS